MDINECVKRAKKGDIDAFEAIVKAYEKKIYNLALRYVNSNEDACDISQEIFIRIYKKISSFKEESSFSTWVYRVAVNACIDHIRKNKKNNTISLHKDNDDEDDEQIEIADTSYSPEIVYDKIELRESIKKAFNYLSEEHRQVIILRDINGFNYDDIGRILDISEGTVKSRIFRAREKLCRILSQDGNIFGSASSKGNRREAGKHE